MRPIELVTATKFSRLVEGGAEIFCFNVQKISDTIDLNFVHRVAHGGEKMADVNPLSETVLDKLEKQYPAVFSEPTYPIWSNR